ncbi:MAG: hypothetical protein U0R69_13615 [Gaiellales bacterium]
MSDVRELAARAAFAAHPARPSRPYGLLRESQWWGRDRLDALQARALGQVLEAASRVPFYRDRMRAAGLAPGELRLPEALAELPPLERDELQRLGVEGLRVPGRHGLHSSSSGSTGKPVEALWPREMIAWFEADERRCNEWLGVRHGERRLWLAASPSTALLRRRIATALGNVTLVPSATLADPAVVRALADSFERRGVSLVWGQSNALYALASGLLAAGRRIRARACWSEGNHLPGFYREPIEEALRCRVHERYGAWETGMLAHECPEGHSFHLSAESVLVELVRDDGRPAAPGELGHVLVTQLRNRAMPLLRYRIGDLAVAPASDTCSCGRGLPVLERLVGRSNELLRATGGGLVLPELVSAVMTGARASVVEFQVEQHADLHVDVRLVQREEPAPERYRAQVAAGIDALIGVAGGTCVERVDSIPLTGAGKLRHIVSNAGGGR